MTKALDFIGINHMVVALALEMSPRGADKCRETDTVFTGGAAPSDADQQAFGGFAISKNYSVIHASFDAADQNAGPHGFQATLTDGLTEAVTVSGGRLWKRDRRTPSVLVFAGSSVVVKLDAKRRIVVREMEGALHEDGYALAMETLKNRATWKPGHMPLVSAIGALPVVLDVRAVNEAFAAAA